MLYVPVLKAKEGEYKALSKMLPSLKGDLLPLVELGPSNWPSYVGKSLQEAWGSEAPIFVDVQHAVAAGASVEQIFDRLRAVDVKVVPVVTPGLHDGYYSGLRKIISECARGACLRYPLNQLKPSVNDNERVNIGLQSMDLQPEQVHFILDLGPIDPRVQDAYAPFIGAMVNAIPLAQRWLSLTVVGSAFPENMSGVGKDSVARRTRSEWLINLAGTANSGFGEAADIRGLWNRRSRMANI